MDDVCSQLFQPIEEVLEEMRQKLRKRLLTRIKSLSTVPVPHKAVRVVGEDRTFRIRIGGYRALYEVSWKKNEILVAIINKRPKSYQKR